MVLVCHDRAFIYLKTYKTAGTSTEMALEPFCAPPGHVVAHATPARISRHGIIGARTQHAKTDTTGWLSHMPAAEVRARLGPDRFDAYLKVASIRNPFDKAVSWFHFAMSQRRRQAAPGEAPPPPGSEPAADEIARFRAFIARQAQVGHFRSPRDIDWRVCWIDGECVIDTFLRLEAMDDDLAALCRQLGISRDEVRLADVKRASRKNDRIEVPDYFDAATADILRRKHAWIFEAGGYSTDPADADRASRARVA